MKMWYVLVEMKNSTRPLIDTVVTDDTVEQSQLEEYVNAMYAKYNMASHFLSVKSVHDIGPCYTIMGTEVTFMDEN